MSRAEQDSEPVVFEAVHCSMTIARPAAGLVVVTIAGSDIGELGDAPFGELARDLGDRPTRLFIDGRRTRGASLSVSGAWAVWLSEHRARLEQVTMLTGSRFIHMTAEFVRRFAELGERMRITTDPIAFDIELERAIAGRR